MNIVSCLNENCSKTQHKLDEKILSTLIYNINISSYSTVSNHVLCLFVILQGYSTPNGHSVLNDTRYWLLLSIHINKYLHEIFDFALNCINIFHIYILKHQWLAWGIVISKTLSGRTWIILNYNYIDQELISHLHLKIPKKIFYNDTELYTTRVYSFVSKQIIGSDISIKSLKT